VTVGETVLLTLASQASSNQELEIRELIKRYSAQSVIGPLSFGVKAGEFVSLLGPSGCGKTTTLRCIAGFESPSEGGIYLDGERIDQRPPNRRNVGLVFQSYALFPHLTVFENIAFGLRLRRCADAELKRRVQDALELVGLSHLADRYPKQLSGGQQQRVAIARSVVLEPRLLLFDEPLSNLDLKLRVTMRAELRNLQRRLGTTAIYVTHDQGEALALSDRIVVMSNGRIEQVGTPVEIYERPATAFVADFIGSSNLLSGEIVTNAPDSTHVRTQSGLLLQSSPPIAGASGSRVTAMIRPENIQVTTESAEDRDNPLSGIIDEKTFLGQDLHLKVRINDAQMLSVVLGGRAAGACSVGDRVNLTVSRSHVYLIGT
jgi:spermidine/putrescine ABC transporter ATP-binding subunit